MKPKPIYIIALIFCISLFSSARSNGKIGNTCCTKVKESVDAEAAKGEDVDINVLSLSPLMFSI